MLGFLFKHPAHFLALGAGSGLLRPMPGTWGSLLGWWLANQCLAVLSLPVYLAILGFGFFIGAWACHITGFHLNKSDDSRIVIDEIWAMLLVVLVVGSSFQSQLYGFLLFRLFDIWKPAPIGWLDRHIKNGFGVMIDDAVAACYALFVLSLCQRLLN
jgi:phosphatidylglycerophosphatase A